MPVSAPTRVSAPVPPMMVSKAVKVKILDIEDWILEVVQILVVFGPVRVSDPDVPTMSSMLKKPPMAASVPLKPSMLPTDVRTTSRPVVYALRSRVSSPACPSIAPGQISPSAKVKVSSPSPPKRVSKPMKSRVGLTVYCEVPGTSDQVLGASIPVRESPFNKLPMTSSALSNLPSPAICPWKPCAVPKAVRVRCCTAEDALKSKTFTPVALPIKFSTLKPDVAVDVPVVIVTDVPSKAKFTLVAIALKSRVSVPAPGFSSTTAVPHPSRKM